MPFNKKNNNWGDKEYMDAYYGEWFLELCLAYYSQHPKFSLIKPITHMLCNEDDDYVEELIWQRRCVGNGYMFDFKMTFSPTSSWETNIPIYFLEDDYKMVLRIFEGDDNYYLDNVNGSSGFSLMLCNFEETRRDCDCCKQDFGWSDIIEYGKEMEICEECLERRKQLINISKFNLIVRDKLPRIVDDVQNHIYSYLLG
jgi:hypothetical protein